MLARFLTGLIAAQGAWARPLGAFNQRWLRAFLGRMPRVKSSLNGTWLGHPLHAAITDIPIGALTVAVVLEVVALHEAADVALGIGILRWRQPPSQAGWTTPTRASTRSSSRPCTARS